MNRLHRPITPVLFWPIILNTSVKGGYCRILCSDHSSRVTLYCPVTPTRLQLGTHGKRSRGLTALKFLLHLGSTWGIFPPLYLHLPY